MIMKPIRKWGDVGIFAVLIQYITIPCVPFFAAVFKTPNKITLFNLLLCPVTFALLVSGWHVMAAMVMLLFIFIDNVDGYVARYLNMTSMRGALFDALTDDLFWLSAVAGAYFFQPHVAYVALLCMNSIDLYLRLVSNVRVEHASAAKTKSPWYKKLYKSINCYGNTFLIFALVLLFAPQHMIIWWAYELYRLSLMLILRVGKFLMFLKHCEGS